MDTGGSAAGAVQLETGSNVWKVAASPDGTRLAIVIPGRGGGGRIVVTDLDGRTVGSIAEVHSAAAWSSDETIDFVRRRTDRMIENDAGGERHPAAELWRYSVSSGNQARLSEDLLGGASVAEWLDGFTTWEYWPLAVRCP